MSAIAFATGGPEWRVTNGLFDVGVTIDDADGKRADTISFSVPNDFFAHPDCVAAALSTLSGRTYERVSFDFPISTRAQRLIESTYDVGVSSSGYPIPPREPGSRISLNFSGGLDSLAALALAGDADVNLVSMDFGGAFAREEAYFSSFDTIVCRTDLRKKGYNRNDWRFMGIGSLLLADYLKLGTIGFGSIFEAAPWNFRSAGAGKAPSNDDPFGAAGTTHTSWIRGLTEFGTAMAVLRHQPDQILPSLKSLATPGSEKYYRKQLLIQIAAEYLGRQVPPIGEIVRPKEPMEFGRSFGVDFVAIYLAKRLGRGTVAHAVSNFPDDAEMRALLASDLGFYMKFNPNFIGHIPLPIRETVLTRMYQSGLEPFHERDYEAYARTRSLLSRYHTIPA